MEIELSGHWIQLVDGTKSGGIGHLLLRKPDGDLVRAFAVRWGGDVNDVDPDIMLAEFEDGIPGYIAGDGTRYAVRRDKVSRATWWVECGQDE